MSPIRLPETRGTLEHVLMFSIFCLLKKDFACEFFEKNWSLKYRRGGVNRALQIRRSVPFFRQTRRPPIALFNPTPRPHPETEVQKFKGTLVNLNAIFVNFVRIYQSTIPIIAHT